MHWKTRPEGNTIQYYQWCSLGGWITGHFVFLLDIFLQLLNFPPARMCFLIIINRPYNNGHHPKLHQPSGPSAWGKVWAVEKWVGMLFRNIWQLQYACCWGKTPGRPELEHTPCLFAFEFPSVLLRFPRLLAYLARNTVADIFPRQMQSKLLEQNQLLAPTPRPVFLTWSSERLFCLLSTTFSAASTCLAPLRVWPTLLGSRLLSGSRLLTPISPPSCLPCHAGTTWLTPAALWIMT